MRAGSLRKRIEIQQCIFTKDNAGAPVENWLAFATAWAQVEDLTGQELAAAAQINETLTTRFTTRYLGSQFVPDTTMRIVYQGKFYDIQSISDTEQAHRELVFMTGLRQANRTT